MFRIKLGAFSKGQRQTPFNLKWKLSIFINNETVIDYGVDIVEISNDKIIRNEVYFDTSRIMKAIKKKQS